MARAWFRPGETQGSNQPSRARTRSVPRTQRRPEHRVRGIVGVRDREEAALAFARRPPGDPVAEVIASTAELVDRGGGGVRRGRARRRSNCQAPWHSTGWASRRGLRRRGFRPEQRRIATAASPVASRSQQLECPARGRRLAPAAELLGPRPHSGPGAPRPRHRGRAHPVPGRDRRASGNDQRRRGVTDHPVEPGSGLNVWCGESRG